MIYSNVFTCAWRIDPAKVTEKMIRETLKMIFSVKEELKKKNF